MGAHVVDQPNLARAKGSLSSGFAGSKDRHKLQSKPPMDSFLVGRAVESKVRQICQRHREQPPSSEAWRRIWTNPKSLGSLKLAEDERRSTITTDDGEKARMYDAIAAP
ncbi:hypothetical protein KM043_014025 [Ampulex compressa]|nr:hypothetical protein KM043_014025 [Ampulex compressa]